MKKLISLMLVLTSLAFCGTVCGQPPGGSSISIAPAYYYHSLALVADSGNVPLISKEYTQFAEIASSERLLGEFPVGGLRSIEGKGAMPHLGFEWERKEIVIGTGTISLELYTRADDSRPYPDAIEPFSFAFEVGNLTPGTYSLLLCKKKLGAIRIR